MRIASEEMRARAREAVKPLADRLEIKRRLEPYLCLRWDGSSIDGPVLHIDDFSGIPFLGDVTGVDEYQHRARLRAEAGHLYAAVTHPTPGYEEYCGERLGLEPVECLVAEPAAGALSLARACGSGDIWRLLIELARSSGRFAIHPFMGIEEVWNLADRVALEAGVPVTVVGPPPPVTWVANDKALFGEVVEAVLGAERLVEGYAESTVGELGRRLRDLAARHRRVALKRVRCASAMGNMVYDSGGLLDLDLAAVEGLISGFLERTEWEGEEAVLAVAWEQSDHSPSTQLWVPPEGSGVARLDGVYDQILQGERRVFVGSRPSTLPRAVQQALAEASLEVGSALQCLGFAGRCSFDFVVVGDPADDFEIKFTECNGRWGGTSTPMALLDRLLGGVRPPYRARDFEHARLVGARFTELLSQVGEAAWETSSGRGRFLFYNTGPLERYGKLDVIALGRTQAEADAALEEELPTLWGL